MLHEMAQGESLPNRISLFWPAEMLNVIGPTSYVCVDCGSLDGALKVSIPAASTAWRGKAIIKCILLAIRRLGWPVRAAHESTEE